MFLPMSWTSPLTVASTIRAAAERSVFSASMNGSRYATARFIARALFTTCGRNIFPEPKRSPTIFIPSMSGPSITSSGRGERLPRLLRVLLDEVDDAVHERVREPLLDRRLAPREVELALRRSARDRARVLDEPLGRVRPPVEEDVLDALAGAPARCPRTPRAGPR